MWVRLGIKSCVLGTRPGERTQYTGYRSENQTSAGAL